MQTEVTLHDIESRFVDMLNGAPDPYLLLLDPYVHFQFVHTPTDRAYAILDGGFPSSFSRRRCEALYKHVLGDFQYFPATISGSLKKCS